MLAIEHLATILMKSSVNETMELLLRASGWISSRTKIYLPALEGRG